MNKSLRRLLSILFPLMILWTLFLVLFFHNTWSLRATKEFPLPNIVFLLIGGVFLTLLFYLDAKSGKKIEEFLCKHVRVILPVSLILLLIWQLYSSYGGFFLSGWDTSVIHQAVYAEHVHDYSQINHGYFSWFPNNMLLVWTFKVVAKASAWIGYDNWEYSLIVFQCLIDVFTLWLLYRVSFDLTKSHSLTFLIYFTAYLSVGLSPWFMVAYSDATGFLLPILIIRLHQLIHRAGTKKSAYVWSVLLGIVSLAAYYLKPQLFICFIAIALTEIWCLLGKRTKRCLAEFAKKAGLCLIGVLIFFVFYHKVVIPTLHLETNPNTTTGWQHYLMMGLNTETNGVYSLDDYNFTQSFPSNQERNRADLQEAGRRIKEMGIGGLIRHLSQKQLVNYGDGTFGWDNEGSFFTEEPEWADNAISPFIRSLIKPDGSGYNLFLSAKQLIWIPMLFLMLFVFIYPEKESYQNGNSALMVMTMSVLGLTLFELLFEARARYLFCYVPLFAVLSGWGTRNLFHLIQKHFPGKKAGARPAANDTPEKTENSHETN